jgi:hypothetical protein
MTSRMTVHMFAKKARVVMDQLFERLEIGPIVVPTITPASRATIV